jgi:hypothetical protein
VALVMQQQIAGQATEHQIGTSGGGIVREVLPRQQIKAMALLHETRDPLVNRSQLLQALCKRPGR